MSDKNHKSEVFIRSDGWVFTKEGMDRLKAGGYKGFDRFKANIEAQIGQWHRVCKPLDADAAAIVMGVKGMVPRAKFVSGAIVAAAKHPHKSEPHPKEGLERGKFMRLTLTEEAFSTISPMENSTFREFVSEAIRRAARK